MMSANLNNITLQKTNEPFHEVDLWGVKPIKELSLILEEEVEKVYDHQDSESTNRLFFATYALEHYIEDLEKTLDRLNKEYLEAKKKNNDGNF
jgi:hypothetical protein